jgi:general secretion pathway protein J
MVVAIGIFAIVAAVSYASLDRFIDTKEMVEARHRALTELQMAMTIMSRDVRFMVNRPVRDGYGDEEETLLSGASSALTEGEFFRLTTSHPEPGVPQSSRPQRVAWRLDNGKLMRLRWDVLDRDVDSREYARTVLGNVASAEIRYLTYSEDGTLQTEEAWTGLDRGLPFGVEFLLTLDDGRQYRRIFSVAGSS